MTYNANNQQAAFGGAVLTYDFNGNLTNDGTAAYSWDVRNRLTSIAAPSLTASFVYDALGRRMTKTINGVSTSFLYDGLNPVQELGGGMVTANLLTGLGIDEYVTRTDAAGSSALLTDALGSTVALTDNSGTVQTQYTYEPFGSTSVMGQANTNSYKYTGREDDGTGLYSYRARYYSPRLQRFISEDPIGLRGGMNLYRYASNNPLRFKDPFGLIVDTSQFGPIDAFNKVMQTEKGRQMYNELHYNRSETYPFKSEESGETFYSNGVIQIDPSTRPRTETKKGCLVQPVESAIAHEMGHAVEDTPLDGRKPSDESDEDEVGSEMNIIDQYENPVRQDLGLPQRISPFPCGP